MSTAQARTGGAEGSGRPPIARFNCYTVAHRFAGMGESVAHPGSDADRDSVADELPTRAPTANALSWLRPRTRETLKPFGFGNGRDDQPVRYLIGRYPDRGR
jgi:hypothetical protein